MGLSARFKPGDRLQRAEEFAPGAALLGEDLAAFGRKPVVAPSALTSFLDPLPFDPPTSFHPAQHWVQGGDVNPEYPPTGRQSALRSRSRGGLAPQWQRGP